VVLFFYRVSEILDKRTDCVDRRRDGREMDGKGRKVVNDRLYRRQCVIWTFVLDHRLENSLIRKARI
jgi:hypothetical protein